MKVWFLESVTDFWEWLVPGHNKNLFSTLGTGAFFHFAGLTHFRDFEIRKDTPMGL